LVTKSGRFDGLHKAGSPTPEDDRQTAEEKVPLLVLPQCHAFLLA
jgi:hypothetical protein